MTVQLLRRLVRHLRRFFAAGIVLTMFFAAPVTGTAASDDGQTWQMATRNADIQEFVAQVAKITGKTVVVDPKLKGQVNVISKRLWAKTASTSCS